MARPRLPIQQSANSHPREEDRVLAPIAGHAAVAAPEAKEPEPLVADGVVVGMHVYFWMPTAEGAIEPRAAMVVGRAPRPGMWYVLIWTSPGHQRQQVAMFRDTPERLCFSKRMAFDGYPDTGSP